MLVVLPTLDLDVVECLQPLYLGPVVEVLLLVVAYLVDDLDVLGEDVTLVLATLHRLHVVVSLRNVRPHCPYCRSLLFSLH